MLLSYRFSNMLSYEEETEFSMQAEGKIPEHLLDNTTNIESGRPLYKTAVIVGENAGGKTNFIESLDYFQSMMFSSGRVYSLKGATNWGADDKNGEQHFSIEAILGEKYYRYQVSLNHYGVLQESLESKESHRKKYQLIFGSSCESMEVKKDEDDTIHLQVEYTTFLRKSIFSKAMRDELEKTISENKYMNGMLLPKIATLDKTARPFYHWFVNQMKIARSPYEGTHLDDKKIDLTQELKIIKSPEFLEIFQMVDSTISKIEVDEKDLFAETIIYHTDSHDRTYDCKLKHESAGVRDFFAWSIKIWQVIYENKVIFADEVDRVLNPVLASRVLAYINGCEHHGQFIFTTHNVLHLNTAYFAKEQMWFVTKDEENLNSELYSLASFKDFSYSSNKNVYELYLKGLLGGVGNG